MSVQSDDTDVLLLIPPDFFLIPSDTEEDPIVCGSESAGRLLLSDLISQVNDLEGRLCAIENQSGVSNEEIMTDGNLRKMKNFGSGDALNTSCTFHSTPLKMQTFPSYSNSFSSIEKLKRNHPKNLLQSSEYVNQKEKDNLLLEEVNKFFTKREVKNNQTERVSEAMKMPSNSTTTGDDDALQLSTAVFNLSKVSDLMKQLEETQVEIEQKLRPKNISGFDGCTTPTKDTSRTYKSLNDDLQENKTPRRHLNFDHITPQANKIHTEDIEDASINDCGVSYQNQNLKLPLDVNDEDLVQKIDEMNPPGGIKGLISLSNLWRNCETDQKERNGPPFDPNTMRQKYLEELCRRQHCEDLIQKVQVLLLEEQQKVAVAMKVDEEKNEVISKLTEGWNRLVNLWRKLENEKSNLETQLESERKKFEGEVTAAFQTVKRYESELSKALDLAQGYKAKCELLEKEKKNLTLDVENMRCDLKNSIEKLENEKSQRERLENALSSKEESFSQGKKKILEMQNQVHELKRSLKETESELKSIKLEKEKLTERSKDERNKMSGMEQQKKMLLQSNEELKKKEKALRENMKTMNDQVDKIKIELKEFYQTQVEQIVQEKLKEFQDQLSTAEKTLQAEMEEREKRVTETAVKQLHQVLEKHVIEVNILEEKHRQEVDLWKIKALQSESRVNELQKKLDQYLNQKSEIAHKLQTVMEAQWQEALKVIAAATSPKSFKNSPNGVPPLQSTFASTGVHYSEEGVPIGNGFCPETDSVTRTCSPSSLPESGFCKEGQITFRDRSTALREENPRRISENSQTGQLAGDDTLKKYIQMLLERPPGFSLGDDGCENTHGPKLPVVDSCNITQWQHLLCEPSGQPKKKPTKGNAF